jgi:hypothetical protein
VSLKQREIDRQQKQATRCGGCGHWKIKHVGGVCLLCVWALEKLIRGDATPEFLLSTGAILKFPFIVCKGTFLPAFGQRELEQARVADPGAYHQEMPCGVCGEAWMTHEGYLCPSGATLFVPALSEGHSAFERVPGTPGG